MKAVNMKRTNIAIVKTIHQNPYSPHLTSHLPFAPVPIHITACSDLRSIRLGISGMGGTEVSNGLNS